MPYIYDPEVKKKIVAGKDDVYSWIKEHLRVSSAGDLAALFQDTIGVQQGLITAPFMETPKDRKIKFDRLLQVDEYDNAYKYLAEPESSLNKQKSNANVIIAGIKGKLSELPTKQEEARKLKDDIKTTDKKLKGALIELDDIRNKKEALDKTKDQIDKLAGEVKSQLVIIDGLEKQLEDAEKDLSIARAAHDLVTRTQSGYEAFTNCEIKLGELEKQRKERDAHQKQAEKINRSILENRDTSKKR